MSEDHVNHIPANTSDYLYIPTIGSAYDKNAVAPGMTGNRVSQAEIDDLFGRMKVETDKMSSVSSIVVVIWLVVFIGLIFNFIVSIQSRSHVASTVAFFVISLFISFIVIFLSLIHI
eukprot:TRINITY_DN6936_c0_g2_i7.p1 TRINITY_DN6936_c0_g2~~TRINITY_DN6936_c0_g2_i7.p1  ORF type:complete len:117 (-),score=5.89 TRINITY_DN6936_c0_g2_i7:1-351(-)